MIDQPQLRSRMQGKSVIVTGGANGIGRATCLMFAQEGANITLTDLDERAGIALVDEIKATGAQALFKTADVTSQSAWQGVVTRTLDQYGSIDTLINNAGIAPFCPVELIEAASWDQVYSINATSQFLGIKAVLPAMKEAGGGSIVNIASGLANRTMPNIAAYCASKGAVRMLTRAAAADLSKYNIRVNCINPGISKSKLTAPLLSDDEFVTNVVAPCPMGRPGNADEIAKAIVFVASDEAASMHGAELLVDGGMAATTMRTNPNFDVRDAI